MGGLMILWLIVQGAVFAVWAVVAFGTLFRLLRVKQRRSGQALPGPRSLPEALRAFWREAEFSRTRRLLFWLTLVLLMLSAGFALLR
jgi:hypothetical protein